MPVFTEHSVLQDEVDGFCGPAEALLFSDTGGLTQFGAFEEILPPGSASSVKHWHAAEDEMVYILSGQVTLEEGDSISVMTAGMVATFKAGDSVGHRFINLSDDPVRYLVIGTRAASDVITYPDDDRICAFDRNTGTRHWTTLDGAPANSPYAQP